MSPTVTRLALAACAAAAIACGGRDDAELVSDPLSGATPGEAVGTAGIGEPLVKLSGCVLEESPGRYVLTSIDDAIVREETGTAGRHRDDPDTDPADANRGAEDERLRHRQNPSAELGRYRLMGDAEKLAMLVNREVEVHGRAQPAGDNEIPAAVQVETIDATGPSCAGDAR